VLGGARAGAPTSIRQNLPFSKFHFGELFPRVGFIVTNLKTDSRALVRFYNKRGTAEQWIKEGKQAVKMTRLSCHHFRSNEVWLWLSLIACNLGNLWRRLVLLAEGHLTRRLFGAMVRRIDALPFRPERARRRGSKQSEGRRGTERCVTNRQ
jgi:hypothetical protein